MNEQLTVELSNLRFFAGHGLYDGEDAWGNEFEVNVALQVQISVNKPLEITETVDYSQAYEIIRNRFSAATGLLENLSIYIADELELAFPSIREVSISIHKLNPPIPQFKGAVGITYKRSRQ